LLDIAAATVFDASIAELRIERCAAPKPLPSHFFSVETTTWILPDAAGDLPG